MQNDVTYVCDEDSFLVFFFLICFSNGNERIQALTASVRVVKFSSQ